MNQVFNILGFDPGNTSGFAFLKRGLPVKLGQVLYDGLFDWLQETTFDVDMIVIENYRVRPFKGNEWQVVIPAKVIGAVEYEAHKRNIPVAFQEPAIKPVAYGWLGMQEKKGFHENDALAHAYYYWIKHCGGQLLAID